MKPKKVSFSDEKVKTFSEPSFPLGASSKLLLIKPNPLSLLKPCSFRNSPITMGKKKNPFRGGVVGGGGGDKLAVFEFSDDDLVVETEARNLAKFGIERPRKRPKGNHQPVDKYVFLECFAKGDKDQRDNLVNEIFDVDVLSTVHDGRTLAKDVMISPGSVNYEPNAPSLLKHRVGCSCGAHISRKAGAYITGKKHVNVLHEDSVEDQRMESRSSSSFQLVENEGLLDEKSSDYGAENNDCEYVVVVSPVYAKCKNRYYTECLLTFSQNWIRLEGSSLDERSRSYCLEWSPFDILKIEHQQSESVRADFVDLHLESKYKNVVETAIGNSGSVELEFVVLEDPQWFKKQESIKSLNLKYKAAWRTIKSECNFSKSFEDITYPDGDPDAVLISRRDLKHLQPRSFINDTIIDFYIKYLLNTKKPAEKHRFHFFNTFFFRKLLDMDRDLSMASEGSDAFRHVRKWTRNVDLFEKTYVVIPINFSLHWSLIVICHPGEIANIRDKGMDDSSKVPCILHMNSIRGSHRGFENLIRSYLWEEWNERQQKQDEDIAMKFLNLNFIELKLPQQENFFDCGLFLLHYAELFLEQASTLGPTRLFDLLNEDWFHPVEVSHKKRDHIRQLIYRIAEHNALRDPSAAYNDKNLQINIHGDSIEQSVHENGVKLSCLDIKSDSSDDCDIKGQHYFMDTNELRNTDKSVTNESCQRLKQQPCTHFSNMKVSMQEGLEKHDCLPTREGDQNPVIIDVHDEESDTETDKESYKSCSMSGEDLAACVVDKQASFPTGDGDPAIRWEADENDKPIAPCCSFTSFSNSLGISSKNPLIIDVRDEEQCTKRDSESYKSCSSSGEDLAACVVEDSEEESGTESNKNDRRSKFHKYI